MQINRRRPQPHRAGHALDHVRRQASPAIIAEPRAPPGHARPGKVLMCYRATHVALPSSYALAAVFAEHLDTHFPPASVARRWQRRRDLRGSSAIQDPWLCSRWHRLHICRWLRWSPPQERMSASSARPLACPSRHSASAAVRSIEDRNERTMRGARVSRFSSSSHADRAR
jgi:hypothetical protein